MIILIKPKALESADAMTKAEQIAGPDAYHIDGSKMDYAATLYNAPSDRPWLVDGSKMPTHYWYRLNAIHSNGAYLADRKMHDPEVRKAPPMIVIYNYMP